jgi:hypothetical protein
MDIDDLIEQLEHEVAHESDEDVEGDEQDVMDIDYISAMYPQH